MGYLLSIVIPTRNRQYYALESVKQILSVTDDRVQIIISDNSDNNSLETAILELRSSRIKYQFISKRIPGVDNYANGIALSDGRYICCIGDDDGVLRNITEIVEWADVNDIKAIKTGVQATYIWPNASPVYKTGCLSMAGANTSVKYVDTKPQLDAFIRSGCLDLTNATLPKAYHGIVRRDMFDIIKERTGRYCGGLSPDIYLCVSLSLIIDRFACLDVPVTIFGACKASTTADSLNKINVSKLEEAPHFVGQEYTWSNKVPRFYCGFNIWADSALHALEDMNATDLLDAYPVEPVTAVCMLRCPEYNCETEENFANNNGDKSKLQAVFEQKQKAYKHEQRLDFLRRRKLFFATYKMLRTFVQRLRKSQEYVMQDVFDISAAEKIVSTSLAGTNKQLLSVLRQQETSKKEVRQ